jgi:RNA polymerase sigma-70 factor (ECF subfamily)
MNPALPDISAQNPTAREAGGAGGVLSREQFAERFRESSRALWCIAASVSRDRAGAEDAVQEAAVIALGKIEEFNPTTNFIAWMGQIVRFVAMNSARTSARRERILRQNASDDLQHDAAEQAWGLSPAMSTALETLEPTVRACLLLRVVAEMSYQQISGVLEIPEGTAMSHVFRARKALASRLEDPSKGGAG